jgi:hypothetical protein
MVSAIEVQHVARTGKSLTVGADAVLDIDYVIRHTTSNEWDGALYELGATAAMQLANQFNVEKGLIANGQRRPRLTKARKTLTTT